MAHNSHEERKQAGSEPEAGNPHQPNEDEVDEASIESFPASDSPGWNSSTGVHKNPKKEKGSAKGDTK